MKKIKENLGLIVLGVLTVLLLGIVVALLRVFAVAEEKPIIVGALFIAGVDDGGWNERHYTGIKDACDHYGVELKIEQNIPETLEDAEPAIDRLVGKGCDVIFLTSDGYNEKLYPVVEKYPKVQFYTTSPDSEPDNMITYYGRHYQARFLAGMVAGRMTKTNVLGFVAGLRCAQTYRSVNSFALGARSVNPDVVVKVMFMDTWADEEKEKEYAERLIKEQGADVITYHASLHSAVDAAEELGVYSIGYNNQSSDYSDKYLGNTYFNWQILYNTIFEDYFTGDMSPGKYYWHGVVYDTVGFEITSPLVTEGIRKEVEDRTDKLINVQDVFYGDLYTNEGEKKCSKGQRISDNALLRKMDWFVEGVEIYE